MLVPEEPEISKIVDLTVIEAVKQRREEFRQIEEHMAGLSSIYSPLLTPPLPKKAVQHCDAIALSASCRVSHDDGFHWKRRFCEVLGDDLTVFMGTQSASGAVRLRGKVSYSFLYHQYVLIRDQDPFWPRYPLLRLFTTAGNVDLWFDNPLDCAHWDEVLSELWDLTFNYDEVDKREESAKEFTECMRRMKVICMDKYHREAQFRLSKEKKKRHKIFRISVLHMRGTDVWNHRPLEVDLYDDYVAFFKPINKSRGTHQREQYKFFLLHFVHLQDDDHATKFTLCTPETKFIFKANRPEAKTAFIRAFLSARGYKENSNARSKIKLSSSMIELNGPETSKKTGKKLKRSKSVPSFLKSHEAVSFTYKKKIANKMSLYDRKSDRTYKLKKKGPSTIGRSSDNDIKLGYDDRVSRYHARIEVHDNIPFVVDNGASTPIYVNDEKVSKKALKPGDVIFLGGKVELVFQVKKTADFEDRGGSLSPPKATVTRAVHSDDSGGESIDEKRPRVLERWHDEATEESDF